VGNCCNGLGLNFHVGHFIFREIENESLVLRLLDGSATAAANTERRAQVYFTSIVIVTASSDFIGRTRFIVGAHIIIATWIACSKGDVY
jgi:hypothetical protein